MVLNRGLSMGDPTKLCSYGDGRDRCNSRREFGRKFCARHLFLVIPITVPTLSVMLKRGYATHDCTTLSMLEWESLLRQHKDKLRLARDVLLQRVVVVVPDTLVPHGKLRSVQTPLFRD